MQSALAALFRLVARLFFRRIEVVGADFLPPGGLLLAPNHPNGLIDPLLIFTSVARRTSFLAKAPLFDTFLVKHFLRALDALPVYRAQDGFDTRRNRETLERAAALLAAGTAIVIFPEGRSHGGSEMSPLKTGAARIALGGRALGPLDVPVHIVPCGLYYTDKGRFRSEAALVFGRPVEVARTELADGEPPSEATRALTAELEEGFASVVLQGESDDVLRLSALACRFVRGVRRDMGHRPSLPTLSASNDTEGEDQALARELALRQRIVARYATTAASPAVVGLIDRMRALEAKTVLYGLEPDRELRRPFPTIRALTGLVAWVVLAPAACAGATIHYPVYRLVGLVAKRAARQDEVALASVKVLAGLLFFPAFWLLACIITLALIGLLEGCVVAFALPLSAILALRFFEAVPRMGAWLSAVVTVLTRGDAVAALEAERRAIYERLLELEASA